jgi:DNA-directed RNA polymerase specialized sigma24 family protein
MESRIPFEVLMEGLKMRNEAAVQELMDLYTSRLIGLAARKMPPWLQAREGPEDIAQTVIKTVTRRIEEGGLTADSFDGLWRLLVRLTVCKVAHRYRDHTTQKRGGGRERSIGFGGDDAPSAADLLADTEPTPDEEAEVADTVEWLMKKLDDPKYQQIVKLALQGESREDIAAAVGLKERQVFRVLAVVREKLEERIGVYRDDRPGA